MHGLIPVVFALAVSMPGSADPAVPTPSAQRRDAAMTAMLSGELLEAEKLWQEEADSLKGKTDLVDLYVAVAGLLGGTQMLLEKYPEAERNLRAAYDTGRAARPKLNEALIQDAGGTLAQVLAILGRYREAEQLFAAHWAFQRRRKETGPEKLSSLLENLVPMYCGAGRFDDAIWCAKHPIELHRKKPFYSDRQLATQTARLADVYLDAGRLDEAKRALDTAWADPWCRDALRVKLGWYHLRSGRPAEAVKFFDAAIAILTKHPIPVLVAEAREGLGIAHVELGDADRGRQLLSQSLAVYEKHLGSNHLRVARVLETYARLFPADGKEHAARAAKIRAANKDQEPRGLKAIFGDLP